MIGRDEGKGRRRRRKRHGNRKENKYLATQYEVGVNFVIKLNVHPV